MIFPHRWVRSIPFPSQRTPPPMANGSAIIIIMRNCNNQTGPPNQTWNTGFPWIKTIFIPNQKFPASLKHLLANPLTFLFVADWPHSSAIYPAACSTPLKKHVLTLKTFVFFLSLLLISFWLDTVLGSVTTFHTNPPLHLDQPKVS